MKTIIAILLIAFSVNTLANDTSLYLGGWSRHFIEGDFNETHDVIAIERNNWVVGYFKNSYSDDSAMIVRKYHVMSNNNFSFNIGLGGVYGYRTCDPTGAFEYSDSKKTCPAVVPEITYTKYETIQPSVMVIAGAVALTFKVNF